MDLESFENIGYLTLFLLLMGGAIGLPIPEDIPLIAAGALSQSGHLSAPIAFATCYTGIVVGDLIIFTIGRRLGPSIFERDWFKKRIPPGRVRLLRKKLSERSVLTIFIARHLFYLRTITFLTCGAVRMPYSRFILADMIAALISAPLMMSIGYFAAEHSEHIARNMQLSALIVGGILLVLFLFHRKKKRQAPASAETSGEK